MLICGQYFDTFMSFCKSFTSAVHLHDTEGMTSMSSKSSQNSSMCSSEAKVPLRRWEEEQGEHTHTERGTK